MGNIASFDDDDQTQLDSLLQQIIADNFTKSCFDRFNEFIARNCYEMAETERVLRLSQSILHMKHDSSLNIQPFHMLYEDFSLTNFRIRPVEGLFDRLADLIGFYDPKNPDARYQPIETISSQNVCVILSIVLDKYQDPKGLRSASKILGYISEVIEDPNETLETVLWAIVCIERLVEVERQNELSTGKVDSDKDEENEICFFKEETKERLEEGLTKLSSYLKEIENLYDSNLDHLRYQVAFCAKWALNYVVSPTNPLNPFPSIKLSADRLIARCDNWRLSTVRSAYPIYAGVYFYEVLLLSGEVFSFGWASEDSHSRDWQKGVGDDASSIGFNAKASAINHRCILWDGRIFSADQTVPDWKAGDVVGCLFDADTHKFAFMLNGAVIKFGVDMPNWNAPFYACASITPHQMAYFNFGQVPFKFPPIDVKCTDFHTETEGDVERFALLETVLDPTCGRYWFKQLLDPENSKFFTDHIQTQFDSWMDQLAAKSTCQSDLTKFDDELLTSFKQLISKHGNDQSILRLIQSFIEKIASKRGDNQSKIPRLFAGMLLNLMAINQNLISPQFSELFQLLHLYKQPKVAHYKQRNLCIVLAIMAAEYADLYKGALFDETIDFLARTICDDSSLVTTQLFALLLLECLAVEKSNWKKLKLRKDNLSSKLNELAQQEFNYYELAGNALMQLECQLSFCAAWFMDNIYAGCEVPDCAESPLSKEVKTSDDQMTIRNDFGRGQNIQLDSSVDSGVYFYEVVLATGEDMLIGWNVMDKDEQVCIIGYDGYSRVIVHGRERIPAKKDVPQWRAGDVLGCLLDVQNGRFAFFLNGTKVEYWILASDNKDYYPAACLSAHQQLRYNHGEVPFKYPPTDVEFRDLRKVLKADSNSCAIM